MLLAATPGCFWTAAGQQARALPMPWVPGIAASSTQAALPGV